jgi:phosphoribosylpyrophosphate synthetase
MHTHARAPQVTIAYPDEGAWKRFHYQFKGEGYPEVICTKVRDGAKRIVRLKEGEPQGRHVVIVDDLVQSGGTLIECHALLSSLGAKHGARARAPRVRWPAHARRRRCAHAARAAGGTRVNGAA